MASKILSFIALCKLRELVLWIRGKVAGTGCGLTVCCSGVCEGNSRLLCYVAGDMGGKVASLPPIYPICCIGVGLIVEGVYRGRIWLSSCFGSWVLV